MSWHHLRKYLADNKMTYQEYLGSDHWKDVRKRFWASRLHDGKCNICKQNGKLEVHHKTYKRIGQEYLGDLILLCRECHQDTHYFEKNREQKGSLIGAARTLRKRLRKETRKQNKNYRTIIENTAEERRRIFKLPPPKKPNKPPEP